MEHDQKTLTDLRKCELQGTKMIIDETRLWNSYRSVQKKLFALLSTIVWMYVFDSQISIPPLLSTSPDAGIILTNTHVTSKQSHITPTAPMAYHSPQATPAYSKYDHIVQLFIAILKKKHCILSDFCFIINIQGPNQ